MSKQTLIFNWSGFVWKKIGDRYFKNNEPVTWAQLPQSVKFLISEQLVGPADV